MFDLSHVILFISAVVQAVSLLTAVLLFIRAMKEHRKGIATINNGLKELTAAVTEAARAAAQAAAAAAIAIQKREQVR